MRDALRRRLAAEAAAIATVIPPDSSTDRRTVENGLARIRRRRQDVAMGKIATPLDLAATFGGSGQAEMNVARLKRDLDRSDASRKDHRP